VTLIATKEKVSGISAKLMWNDGWSLIRPLELTSQSRPGFLEREQSLHHFCSERKFINKQRLIAVG